MRAEQLHIIIILVQRLLQPRSTPPISFGKFSRKRTSANLGEQPRTFCRADSQKWFYLPSLGFTWLYLALPNTTGPPQPAQQKCPVLRQTLSHLSGHEPRNGSTEHRLGKFPSCSNAQRFGPQPAVQAVLRSTPPVALSKNRYTTRKHHTTITIIIQILILFCVNIL
jgi:hypothetical protein